MKNDYLDFYGKHGISPVKQDISSIETHYERRRKLYRQCGIPLIAFKDAEVLEVGPGGGYNTLAFFHWNCKHVDLVEANEAGQEDMQKLFAKQNVPEDKYEIFSCKIEDYKTDKKYDIIIAEGFLPNVYNKQEIIDKLQELVSENGIVVITCIENAAVFVEVIKRLIGVALTSNINEYDKKVKYLSDFFEPQLNKLRGVSRSAKDWVQDQIMNPVNVNGTELTMLQAIEYFENGFDVLGCSPQMFTDYSWYKDIWYDYINDYKEQFNRKRLSLLLANRPELILPEEKVEILVKGFEGIKEYASEYEKEYDGQFIDSILQEMGRMAAILEQDFDVEFLDIFHEIREALLCLQKGENIDIENYPKFFSAFGRTQQYISFVKK